MRGGQGGRMLLDVCFEDGVLCAACPRKLPWL